MTDDDASRLSWWLVAGPIYVAFWLVWLMAKTGQRHAIAIHQAMWDAELAVPPITQDQKQWLDE